MAKASGSIDLNAMKEASKVATNCLFEVTNGGVWLTPIDKKPNTDGTPVTSGDNKTSGTLINADGVGIYNAGIKVAQYGTNALIGREASGCYNILIDATGGISLRNNTTAYTTLSINGLTLGKVDEGHVDITPSGMRIYGGNTYAYDIAHLGYASGSNDSGGASEAPYFTFGNRIGSSNLIFSPSVVYTYGDKINYEDESYVCIVKNSATGNWNYTQFERIIGNYSTVSGQRNIASGFCSLAEGLDTQASKPYSHAEGRLTKAIGYEAHAEGYKTQATGTDSHAQGCETIANDLYSHAEGYGTKAIASSTHAEGHHSIASGTGAHAQNYYTVASGHSSHAQNYYTVATRNYQTVIGKFNKATKTGGTGSISDPYTYTDSTDAAFIIGGGTGSATEERADILTVDWNGTITANGYICNNIGGNSTTTHASVLRAWFNNNKSSISRNTVLSYWSNSYGNGSQYIGYFLDGYDTSPYGGFFVCHYTSAKYVGISDGNFTEYEITKTATSSRKTKENIKSMTEKEAKKLYDLDVISFDYKKGYEEGKKNQFGLIAEDCDKIIPYVVYKPDDNEDSIWGIDYTKFVPYLIKNLQLHEQKIKELEKEIEILKSNLMN